MPPSFLFPQGESSVSPLHGNLSAGNGSRPAVLPVTHTLTSPVTTLGQEWRGGLHLLPGMASSANQGIGYLLPQPAAELVLEAGQGGPLSPAPHVSVGQGLSQASGPPPCIPLSSSSPNPSVSLPPPQEGVIESIGEVSDSPSQADPVSSESDVPVPSLPGSEKATLPALLSALEALSPSLVASVDHQPKLLTGPEAHAQSQKPVRELRVPESPLLASILEETEREIQGLKDSDTKDGLALGEKHLRTGSFLPSARSRFKSFDRPSHPVSLSALPPRALSVQEVERQILPDFEGKSSPSFSATIPDGALADWEESLRLSLEHSSMLERFIDTLYMGVTDTLPNNAELSEETAKALLVASSSCAKAVLRFGVRSYLNVVLARRDALLAKAKSRLPSAEKEALRALPLDQAGLLGPKALQSASLRPPSESSAALLKVAEALKARPPANKPSPSPARKRPFSGTSSKGKADDKGKRSKLSGGKGSGKSHSKPSTPKKSAPPP